MFDLREAPRSAQSLLRARGSNGGGAQVFVSGPQAASAPTVLSATFHPENPWVLFGGASNGSILSWDMRRGGNCIVEETHRVHDGPVLAITSVNDRFEMAFSHIMYDA